MGLLSTIGAASGRAFGLTRVGAAIRDTYFNLVTLLLPGNGTNGAQNNTFLDSGTANSGSGFTITRNGDVTQGTFSPFSQTGWSNFFNGTTDYLAVANNAAFNFGSGDFTLEAFIFPNFSSERHILGYAEGTNTTRSFYFAANSTYTKFYWYTDGTTANTLTSATVSLNNSWNHVAVSRSGSTLYLFVNGVLSNSSSISGSLFSNVNCVFNIGREANFNAAYFPGHISNVRVIKGTALYTATFTPPAAPLTNITNTSLLTCQSNRFIDNGTANTGGTPFTVTPNGTPSIQAFSPFAPTAEYSAATVGGSGYFDGTGDYLTAPAGTAFAFGTGSWTVEAWVYVTSLASEILLFDTRSSVSTAGVGCRIATDGTLSYSGSANNALTTTAIRINSWNHVVWVYNGTTLAGFINGSRGGTATPSFNITQNNAYIGQVGFSASGYMVGYISSLRVVKGSAVYDPTQTTLTMPTAPLTNITNTSLLLNFTNAGITDATAKNDLQTIGTAQISTAQSKFGGSSIYIPGTATNYVKCATSANLFDIAGADFTIEFWVRFDSLAANRSFVSKYGNSTETLGDLGYNLEWLQSTNQLRLVLGRGTGSGDALYTWSWTPSTGIWYHVAVTRSGTSGRAFIDGTQIGTTSTVITNDVASPNSVIIGKTHTVAQYMNGYMSGIRITKGFARYTANFTAPTAAFPLQ